MKGLVRRFVRVRGHLLETVSGFPKARVDEVAFGKWHLRDMLAHLAGWDSYFAEIVERLSAGSDVPYWGSIAKFNEASVRERAGRSFVEVYDEFVAAGQAFVEAYGSLAGSLWSKRLWQHRSATPAWVVEINIAHYAEHLERIVKRLDECRE